MRTPGNVDRHRAALVAGVHSRDEWPRTSRYDTVNNGAVRFSVELAPDTMVESSSRDAAILKQSGVSANRRRGMETYPEPVDQLLRLGEGTFSEGWDDYTRLGLGPSDIPTLIRLALDRELAERPTDDPAVWAQLHAWRALGQFRAEEAVRPLLQVLTFAAEEHEDWGLEELPVVFGMIGPAAIPDLTAYLADEAKPLFARMALLRSLEAIAKDYPESRDACVEPLVRLLEGAARNDPGLNGFAISSLVDLDVVAAAPIIEKAFADGHVDESIRGDWPSVRYELGLGRCRRPGATTSSGCTGGAGTPTRRGRPGGRTR